MPHVSQAIFCGRFLLFALLLFLSPIHRSVAGEITSFCNDFHITTDLYVSLTSDWEGEGDTKVCPNDYLINMLGLEEFGYNPPFGLVMRFFGKTDTKTFLEMARTGQLGQYFKILPWRKVKRKRADVGSFHLELIYERQGRFLFMVSEVAGGVLAINIWKTGHASADLSLDDFISHVLEDIFPLTDELERILTGINKNSIGPKIRELKKLPRNLRQAVEYIWVDLNEESRKALGEASEEDAPLYHFGFGTFIRNELGLWAGDSPIAKHFKARGICHPESMSGFIIKGLIAKANHKKIRNLPRGKSC